MSPSFMFQVGLVIAASVAGTYYLAGNVETEEVVLESEVVAPAKPEYPKGSIITIPRSNGQFFTHGRVNSGTVRFLIDTGASTVALTAMDAQKAGIRMRDLTFDRPVDTANGRTMGASVKLRDVSLGGVRVTNVDAIVLQEGLSISLLGMSFLGELQKVEVTQNQMVLRR
ncbi:MAG: TIGR02281 family clan AA aspartic protease [Pseudomonadota bacterium]